MRNLGTVGKSNLFGVAALSSILQHELQHMANAHDLQDHGAQDDDGDGMRTTSGTVENLFGYIILNSSVGLFSDAAFAA